MVKTCELINYDCQDIEHLMFVPHYWTVYNIKVRFSHNRTGPYFHGFVFFFLPRQFIEGIAHNLLKIIVQIINYAIIMSMVD